MNVVVFATLGEHSSCGETHLLVPRSSWSRLQRCGALGVVANLHFCFAPARHQRLGLGVVAVFSSLFFFSVCALVLRAVALRRPENKLPPFRPPLTPFQVVGTVPLHVAVYRGGPGVLEALLAGPGGEVAANTKNSEGATPLHVACRKNVDTAPEALALLREDCPVKVDVDAADDGGRTPLLGASHYGHADVVEVCRLQQQQRQGLTHL